MTTLADFGQVRQVKITVLVDNRADLIVRSTETVKRFGKAPLLAEHGFSALVELVDEGITLLWDAGISKIALLENVKRMEIDLSQVDKIALSHGHGDHTAAMTDVIQMITKPPTAKRWPKDTPVADILKDNVMQRVPLIAHPLAFCERWARAENGDLIGPRHCPPRAEWEAAGAEIVLSEGPYPLGPGCWTTGAVPRRSFEHAGISGNRLYRDDKKFLPDILEDDQAIVLNVQDLGLVVLSGCAHSGILNTVRYAQEISGVDTVWAILGGFHLAPASREDVQRTIQEIQEINPTMIVPTHCTGFDAACQFAQDMPDAFVLGTVGTSYLFGKG